LIVTQKREEQRRAGRVLVLGSFAADLAFRAARLPAWGETLMGSAFAPGPGGKGSNQAIAAARAGARVQILSKLGDDAFGQLARTAWAEAGVDFSGVATSKTATGAAAILIDEQSGQNAIVVVPGACYTLTPAEVEQNADTIRASDVFLAQLELPIDTVVRGLEIAHGAGVTTILNPAPAPKQRLSPDLLRLVDYLIPNETEAAQLSGMPVSTAVQAAHAGNALFEQGPRNVIVTLGEHGSCFCTSGQPVGIPPFHPGPVVDTTGAGDAFCGAFAAALAEGRSDLQAAHFASAAAGLAVTRHGTALSTPFRPEIEALLH
jgi:ribokinase